MQNVFKVNNRSTRRRSGVLLLTLNIFDTFFFAAFKHVNGGWNTLLPQSKFIRISELNLGDLSHLR